MFLSILRSLQENTGEVSYFINDIISDHFTAATKIKVNQTLQNNLLKHQRFLGDLWLS